jgi:hypothetical protein
MSNEILEPVEILEIVEPVVKEETATEEKLFEGATQRNLIVELFKCKKNFRVRCAGLQFSKTTSSLNAAQNIFNELVNNSQRSL